MSVRAYVDSDVLIWHLRGDRRALAFLRRLTKRAGVELWTGAMQRAEVVFFMRSHEEEPTLALLARFRTHPVTEDIVERAGTLYRRWRASHGIDPNDALLAATVLSMGGELHTLNTKHYPIPDLAVRQAWSTGHDE